MVRKVCVFVFFVVKIVETNDIARLTFLKRRLNEEVRVNF